MGKYKSYRWTWDHLMLIDSGTEHHRPTICKSNIQITCAVHWEVKVMSISGLTTLFLLWNLKVLAFRKKRSFISFHALKVNRSENYHPGSSFDIKRDGFNDWGGGVYMAYLSKWSASTVSHEHTVKFPAESTIPAHHRKWHFRNGLNCLLHCPFCLFTPPQVPPHHTNE